MAKQFEQLTQSHIEFIEAQKMFFIATAPDSGRINLSPKGLDSFRVMDNRHVAFLNLTGSGNETAAHLIQNGRVTAMFCSYEGDPLILRLYGNGSVVHKGEPGWDKMSSLFPDLPGKRQFILIEIEMVQASCGFAVPLYEYVGQRDLLTTWAEKQGDSGIREYWNNRNRETIDGLDTHIPVKD